MAKTATYSGQRPASKIADAAPTTVRLNCLIPSDLHKRVKIACAKEGVSMTDVVVEFLEGRFPKVK
jgi:hypothetical protein